MLHLWYPLAVLCSAHSHRACLLSTTPFSVLCLREQCGVVANKFPHICDFSETYPWRRAQMDHRFFICEHIKADVLFGREWKFLIHVKWNFFLRLVTFLNFLCNTQFIDINANITLVTLWFQLVLVYGCFEIYFCTFEKNVRHESRVIVIDYFFGNIRISLMSV